jgi:hypothetical protein
MVTYKKWKNKTFCEITNAPKKTTDNTVFATNCVLWAEYECKNVKYKSKTHDNNKSDVTSLMAKYNT